MCAECHGFAGDGFPIGLPLNDPSVLPGAGNVSQLASYISTNMPMDAVGSCNTSCGTAVAEYISTTFWPEPAPACSTSTTYHGARQIKLLTRKEYQRTVQDLIGVNFDVTDTLSADLLVGYFPNNTHLAVTSATYDQYIATAEEIANWANTQNFATLNPSINCNSTFNQTCANNFMSIMAPRIFRRALDSAEQTEFMAMANGSLTGGDVKAGIRLALESMLSSPQFLYRHEIGELNSANAEAGGHYELTSYEMATWLSYTLTGSTPDATAHSKGVNNQLRTPANILAEAQRLMGSATATPAGTARSREAMGDFVGAWLDTDNMELSPKNATTWPQWTATLRTNLKQEIRENFAHVMLNSAERFPALYNADYTFVNQALASHYGISGVSGTAFTRVNTSERGGILVNGGFMARWAEDVESSPIRRAARVRRRMLCQNLPAPPAGIALDREAAEEENQAILNDPTTTNRMKYTIVTAGDPCDQCHMEWINPLGFGMEDYDAVGRKRSSDLRNNPIDATGRLYAPNLLSEKTMWEDFMGAEGLGDLLPTLPKAQSCFAQNMFRYMTGVGVDGIDSSNLGGPKLDPTEKNGYICEAQTMTGTLTGTSPRAMLENMGSMDAVRYRRAWPRQ